MLWLEGYGGGEREDAHLWRDSVKNRLHHIAQDLLTITAAAPTPAGKAQDRILVATRGILDLSAHRFHADGGASLEAFNRKGNDLLGALHEALTEVRRCV